MCCCVSVASIIHWQKYSHSGLGEAHITAELLVN